MTPSPSEPAAKPDGPAEAAGPVSAPQTIPGPAARAQPSRVKTVWVGGHFDPAVALALKTLALREGTTVQALIGRALNDLLEGHRLGRPAGETVLPRGGAARRRAPPCD